MKAAIRKTAIRSFKGTSNNLFYEAR